MSPRLVHSAAVAALVALAAITLTGAAVRLTGSGLGCADWPRCSATKFVDVSSYHAAIEQINRLFTFVVALPTLGVLVLSWRRRPYRADLVRWSALIVVGVAANAILGGVSVKVELHPVVVQAHMLLSLATVAAATVLVRRSGEPDDVPLVSAVSSGTRGWVLAMFGLTWVVLVTGTLVTAAGPHAGDENAQRLNVAIHTVVRVHSVSVWIAVLTAAALAWRLVRRGGDTAVTGSLSRWVIIGVLQGAVGYLQYATDVPPALVELHILGAVLMTWAATTLVLDCWRPAGVGTAGPHVPRAHEPRTQDVPTPSQ